MPTKKPVDPTALCYLGSISDRRHGFVNLFRWKTETNRSHSEITVGRYGYITIAFLRNHFHLILDIFVERNAVKGENIWLLGEDFSNFVENCRQFWVTRDLSGKCYQNYWRFICERSIPGVELRCCWTELQLNFSNLIWSVMFDRFQGFLVSIWLLEGARCRFFRDVTKARTTAILAGQAF